MLKIKKQFFICSLVILYCTAIPSLSYGQNKIDKAQKLHQVALKYYANGDYNTAIKKIEKAIKLTGGDEDFAIDMLADAAVIYAAAQDTMKSCNALNTLLDIVNRIVYHPSNGAVELYGVLAHHYYEIKQYAICDSVRYRVS